MLKPLLIAAALCVVPSAVSAQVAAGTLPNTFDRPAGRSVNMPVVPTPQAPAAPPVLADARSEDTLRTLIAGAQAGAMDYALLETDLAAKVKAQDATVTSLIQGFGALQAVDFVRSQNGADLYAVIFANAVTQWVIGFDDAGKVDALLFRPAEAAPAT